jgi:hypothetical protein
MVPMLYRVGRLCISIVAAGIATWISFTKTSGPNTKRNLEGFCTLGSRTPETLCELTAVSLNSKLLYTPASGSADSSGKTYVQQLIDDDSQTLADLILNRKAYIYVCGDAKHMAKEVEARLCELLGRARHGAGESKGRKELKLLSDRRVSRLGLSEN